MQLQPDLLVVLGAAARAALLVSHNVKRVSVRDAHVSVFNVKQCNLVSVSFSGSPESDGLPFGACSFFLLWLGRPGLGIRRPASPLLVGGLELHVHNENASFPDQPMIDEKPLGLQISHTYHVSKLIHGLSSSSSNSIREELQIPFRVI